jgi:Ca2+-binding RTX toxin-like protein
MLIGSVSTDTLDGYHGDDILQGGAGGDTLVGGYGADTATYAASAAGVTINFGTGLAGGGDAAGDTLSGIENITGSSFNDVITGDNGRNVLVGGEGADILAGMEHGDTLDGGEGNDILVGGINSDRFVFSGSDWGKDTVLDYETGYDELDLRGHGFDLQDLKLIYADGNATVVTAHGSFVLAGVSGGLSADDFLL